MPRTQANRQAAISTSLGEDVLLLKSLSATEHLGRLFQFQVELLSENHELKFEDIVGQNATVRLTLPEDKARYFNGYVNRFVQAPGQGLFAHYHATLVPWLWFLTRTADCRIFQEMAAPDIIEQVFRDHGFTDFKKSLSETYCKREYCVQYRETDFNFVSRLMEQEGIYYFFEHENGKHTMVLADSKSAHTTFPGYETIPHRYLDEAGVEQEYVFDWLVEQEVQSGIVCLNDFDFEKPKNALTVKANVSRQHAVPNFEVFDYPGDYTEYKDGEAYVRRRIEELQVQHELVRARGRAKGLCAGSLFTLEGHHRSDQNREYLLLEVSCEIKGDDYESTAQVPKGDFFSCRFVALNSETPFRSARRTPKPAVQGPQTAIVVGPSGEEIYTDKYGRVKVQFHWDRRSKADENSSCWVRTSQLSTGKSWGAMSIPRVGQEVIVEFLEGDPDRPIITGRVYNGESMPPYRLPDQKTMSTMKSNSSKGGKGFNEIRLEDKKGEEQIFIHAEKNQDIRVKNNVFEWVGNDRHLIVKNNQFERIKNNRHETVAADHFEGIGKDRHLKVLGKEAKSVEGSHSFTVKGDVIEVFKQNHSEKVTEDLYFKAKNIVIEAEENITINVGDSYIAIEKDGIKVSTNGELVFEAQKDISHKGTKNFTIEATAGLKLSSPAKAEISSAATTVKADGILTVQGSMVKIN
jgi:type VI secretion system secreted protein VgrG